MSSKVVLLLFAIISRTIASLTDFCESNYLRSAFSIDADMYFVSFKNNTNIVWKFDIRSNDVFVDHKMKSFAEKLGFNVKSPILGFKFSEIYECSKSKSQCKDKNYKFEHFDHCNKNHTTLQYCRNQTQLQDITLLIGSNNRSQQSYRALRQKNSGFELISDKDMPFEWPASSPLKDSFLKINSDKEVVVGIVYSKARYELAMIVKSKGKFKLKVSTLDTYSWFQNWKTFTEVPIKQFVGLIEKDSKLFAVTAFDDSVFSYEANGQNNSERKLEKQNFNFENLFNCNSESDDSSEDVILKAGVPVKEDNEVPTGTMSSMPETNPMIFLVIPIFTIATVCTICGLYFLLCRPNANMQNKSALKHVLNK